jgi:hypothetical protein
MLPRRCTPAVGTYVGWKKIPYSPGGKVILTGATSGVPISSWIWARWETVMLPGVGHTPQLEAPDNVIVTVRDWLGRPTPGTR